MKRSYVPLPGDVHAQGLVFGQLEHKPAGVGSQLLNALQLKVNKGVGVQSMGDGLGNLGSNNGLGLRSSGATQLVTVVSIGSFMRVSLEFEKTQRMASVCKIIINTQAQQRHAHKSFAHTNMRWGMLDLVCFVTSSRDTKRKTNSDQFAITGRLAGGGVRGVSLFQLLNDIRVLQE